MPVGFLRRDKKGVDPKGKRGGEDLREVCRGETNQNILYEKSLFSIK